MQLVVVPQNEALPVHVSLLKWFVAGTMPVQPSAFAGSVPMGNPAFDERREALGSYAVGFAATFALIVLVVSQHRQKMRRNRKSVALALRCRLWLGSSSAP
jgi:hypothetical protein